MEITTMAGLFSYMGTGFALLGATLAVALACVGAARGSGFVGEAGAGLLSEDPSKFSKVLILEVIPGTNGLYGLVVWFVALVHLGAFGGNIATLSFAQGLTFFAACIPMMVGGYFSALAQGRVAAASVGVLAKQEGEWAKGMILCVLIEFFAILSLLASFLTITSIPV
ncbi:MAG: V-type ATP synthase subunit K [Oscillospiraceae bacterium]|nr:V-type ATP synthase subunit K [Oscillospiraceae bacterium]